jgi:regulator of RNase E activity RraA
MTTLTKAQTEFLQSIDTPTVCNVLEMVAPERRGHGYTTQHLHCPFPALPPMVGFAKTVTCRSRDKVNVGDYMQKRLDYLDYVASAPNPSWVIVEDLDQPPGHGAYWGEVMGNIHKSLDCVGTITNGGIRDIPQIPPGFQMLAGSIAPSHAYVHVVDYGVDVTVHGMKVKSGDLIHADQHGAVVVPLAVIDGMKPAFEKLAQREAKIIAAAKENKGVAAIKAAYKG